MTIVGVRVIARVILLRATLVPRWPILMLIVAVGLASFGAMPARAIFRLSNRRARGACQEHQDEELTHG